MNSFISFLVEQFVLVNSNQGLTLQCNSNNIFLEFLYQGIFLKIKNKLDKLVCISVLNILRGMSKTK